LLNGVTVIDAALIAKPSGDWNGKLYRPREAGSQHDFQARLIPYYAWANRRASEMSVWIPVK
jgi:uncharacterized protein